MLVFTFLIGFGGLYWSCEPNQNSISNTKSVDSLENLLQICRNRLSQANNTTNFIPRNLSTEEIVNSLYQNPEIIEKDPVLGGNMHFNKGDIQVLNDHWVYATFEDGHILGEGIFSYTIDKNKNLNWEVVISDIK